MSVGAGGLGVLVGGTGVVVALAVGDAVVDGSGLAVGVGSAVAVGSSVGLGVGVGSAVAVPVAVGSRTTPRGEDGPAEPAPKRAGQTGPEAAGPSPSWLKVAPQPTAATPVMVSTAMRKAGSAPTLR